MTGCPDRHDALSALVDGALCDPDRDRLLAHLTDCAGCRGEAAELRRLRDRVRSSAPEPPAPPELTERLTAIAGDRGDTPLYARPFDAGPRGATAGPALPSARRRRRALTAGSLAGGCLGLVGAVGIGWAAAPATQITAIDPTPTARGEFAAVLAADRIGNRAVAAARGTDRGGPRIAHASAPEPAPAPVSDRAGEWLQRADQAGATVPVAGTQQVQVRHLNGYWQASAQVLTDPATGSQVTAAGSDRQHARSWWPSRAPGVPAAELVAAHHRLVTGPGPVVAGRESQVVEARTDSGRPVARWWLDRETAVVLWQQTLDEAGRTVLSAGWTRVRIGTGAMPAQGVRTMKANQVLALTGTGPGQAPALTQQGWHCWEQLAGLDLVQVRRGEVPSSASGRAEEMLHTVYGDGVATLSVVQQRGALGGAPEGFVWDPRLRAYRSLGITTTLVWQSGNTVITVVTDGSDELAARAVGSLPHQAPVLRTRTQRVIDGWQRILGATG